MGVCGCVLCGVYVSLCVSVCLCAVVSLCHTGTQTADRQHTDPQTQTTHRHRATEPQSHKPTYTIQHFVITMCVCVCVCVWGVCGRVMCAVYVSLCVCVSVCRCVTVSHTESAYRRHTQTHRHTPTTNRHTDTEPQLHTYTDTYKDTHMIHYWISACFCSPFLCSIVAGRWTCSLLKPEPNVSHRQQGRQGRHGRAERQG
jgi:hypothetical protein